MTIYVFFIYVGLYDVLHYRYRLINASLNAYYRVYLGGGGRTWDFWVVFNKKSSIILEFYIIFWNKIHANFMVKIRMHILAAKSGSKFYTKNPETNFLIKIRIQISSQNSGTRTTLIRIFFTAFTVIGLEIDIEAVWILLHADACYGGNRDLGHVASPPP